MQQPQANSSSKANFFIVFNSSSNYISQQAWIQEMLLLWSGGSKGCSAGAPFAFDQGRLSTSFIIRLPGETCAEVWPDVLLNSTKSQMFETGWTEKDETVATEAGWCDVFTVHRTTQDKMLGYKLLV